LALRGAVVGMDRPGPARLARAADLDGRVSRDPTDRLPRLPEVTGKQARHRRENKLVKKTNSTLEGVEQLGRGKLSAPRILEPVGGSEDGWSEANEEVKERILEIREAHREQEEGEKLMTGPEALHLLTRLEPTDYGANVGEEAMSARVGMLQRGDVIDLVPEDIKFPVRGTVPRLASSISPSVDGYFAKPESMLVTPTPELEEERKLIRPFSDPGLKRKSMLLR
jgi:hypothetical protein